jgi:hypothetical protein
MTDEFATQMTMDIETCQSLFKEGEVEEGERWRG